MATRVLHILLAAEPILDAKSTSILGQLDFRVAGVARLGELSALPRIAANPATTLPEIKVEPDYWQSISASEVLDQKIVTIHKVLQTGSLNFADGTQ